MDMKIYKLTEAKRNAIAELLKNKDTTNVDIFRSLLPEAEKDGEDDEDEARRRRAKKYLDGHD